MDTETKQQIIDDYKQHEGDTGSPEIQIALLTARINQLTEHLRSHKRDYSTRQGLMRLVGRRGAMLRYLNGKDEVRYSALIQKLGLRR